MLQGKAIALKGKIIKILDDKRVIVNLGYNEGVKKDMKFIIYDEGEEIIDPESYISLGKREIMKHKIKAIHIQEKFSIMVSDVWVKSIIDKLFDSGIATQKKFSLKGDADKDKETNLYVKVGDFVRQDLS